MLKSIARHSTRAALATLFVGAALAGCGSSTPSDQGQSPEKVHTIGQIGAELTLGSVTINRVDWTLKYLGSPAPTGWTGDRTGFFDVTGSGSTFTGLITGVPAGTQYDLTFNATSTDNTRVCSGHAMPTPFAVVGGQTVLQVVHLNCQDTRAKTGSILVNGDINACPTADGLSANVLTQMVGGNITLTGMASDPDMAPMPLSYSFALSAMQPSGAGAGTITSASPTATGTATFRCDSPGPVSVTMSVGDGDTQCTADTFQIVVNCTGQDFCLNVTCPAPTMCQQSVTCDHTNGMCITVNKADNTTCDDGNPNTANDKCVGGVCGGANLCAGVTCTALDQCHDVGTCTPSTGVCTNPAKANNTACNDGNGCTQTDTCQAGTCTGGNPVVCTAQPCQVAGTCTPATGTCSAATPAANGTACNDGSSTTLYDACVNGACVGNNSACNPAFSCCSCESTTAGNCTNTSTLGDHLTTLTTAMTGTRAPASVCTLASPCNASGTPDVVGGVAYSTIFRKILDCFHSTGCAGADGAHHTDCFCGIGVNSNTCFGSTVSAATGPCKDIIVQGVDSNIMADISNRYTDNSFPIGAATQMSEICDGLSCGTQCLGGNKQ